MKKLFTIVAATVISLNIYGQPVLTGGFGITGMGFINGDTYTKTGTVGNSDIPFVSASKSGATFYAAAPAASKLYFVSASSGTITDSMAIYLRNLASSNETDILFGITLQSLCRVNTATKSLVDSVLLGAPWQLEERPNHKEVWVSDSGKVHVVDYTGGLSTSTINVTSSPYDYGGVKFTPGGSIAYKAASTSQKLFKINAATRAIVDSVSTAPFGFSNLVVSHDSSKLFVCDPTNSKIWIYNTSDLSIADSIDCGSREPFNIYRHPSRNEIWVANHFDDSLTVYNENTYAQIAAFGCSSSPWYIAFGTASTSVKGLSATKMSVFPNPAHDEVTIDGLEPGDNISVVDILGAEVIPSATITTLQRLNISTLKAGSYIIRITGKDGNRKTSTLIEKI